jgi:anthranilate synthase component 1
MVQTMTTGSATRGLSGRWSTRPSLEEVAKLARNAAPDTRAIPIFREVMADLETPVSAFLKIRDTGPAFLLESIEGGERLARYSFIGADPIALLTLRDGVATLKSSKGETRTPYSDPLQPLAELVATYKAPELPELPLPRFSGGAVGYLSYEAVRAFEPRVPEAPGAGLDLPDGVWMLTDSLLVFDHLARTIRAVSHVTLDGTALEDAYHMAERQIDRLIDRLRA